MIYIWDCDLGPQNQRLKEMKENIRYDNHEEEWDRCINDSERNKVAATWLAQGETLDRWRHERMYKLLKPIIEHDPNRAWLTVGDGHTIGNDASDNLKIVSSAGENFILSTGDDFFVYAGSDTRRLKVDNSGDISFYEDTGTTAKFFWDASAEKLEIGGIQGGADGLLAVKTNADNHAIAIEEASGSEAYAIGVEADGSLGFYNSGSTTASVTFDDSGNVLVGTTSTDQSIAGHGFKPDGFAYHTRNGGAMLRLNRLTSDGDIMQFQKDGTTVGNIASGASGYEFKWYGAFASGAGLGAYSNVSIRPLSNTGAASDNAVNLGHSSQRFKDLYLSGGVVFGTGGPSPITSNTLDDYEEGSWTPSLGAASANPTVGYNAQVGHYTKIGNLVTVSCRIVTNSRSGGSGHLLVRGLPFTVATAEAYASATIGFNYNWNTPPQHAGAQANTVTVLLYQDGRTNAVSGSGDIAASGSSYLNLTCSYITNA